MSGVAGTRLVAVGELADFELNRFNLVDLAGREIGVVRTDRGFFAVHNSCPHQGAPVCEGMLSFGTMAPSAPHSYRYARDELVLRCPWHRWEFDLTTGRTIGGVAKQRLAVYPVEVIEDEVFVRLKEKS